MGLFFNALLCALVKSECHQIYRTRRSRGLLSNGDVTFGIWLPVSALFGRKFSETRFFEVEYLRNGDRERINISHAVVSLQALQHIWASRGWGLRFGGQTPKKQNAGRKNSNEIYRSSKTNFFFKICKSPGDGG